MCYFINKVKKEGAIINTWYEDMTDEDMIFIKRFVLSSGSLKQVAKEYSVSYPTVRNRLNEVINKIDIIDEKDSEPFIMDVMRLVTDDEISYNSAKKIIDFYEGEQDD
ncbi:hypothetical protein RD055328_12170 [Companilactobacillus sp. RD055328]|nr:DUF2089 family protein [Companilactobacillus sp. RD055328]GKQ43294.1 hypothetical protein RD055328_12170 [Companilactobacillus sp. RD055328]